MARPCPVEDAILAGVYPCYRELCEDCPNRVTHDTDEEARRAIGQALANTTDKSIMDLMGKDELRQQLEQQTDIIVDIENRNARLERILSMCLSLKSEYREALVETKAKVKELENPPRRILACDLCGKEIMPGRICRTCIIEQDGRSG